MDQERGVPNPSQRREDDVEPTPRSVEEEGRGIPRMRIDQEMMDTGMFK